MLKPENQVTLFVNYSYNSFYAFCSSENTYCENKVVVRVLSISDTYVYVSLSITDLKSVYFQFFCWEPYL